MLKFDEGGIGNSYSMACPPVRGDNPRALASGLSYVHVEKHGITITNTIYISVDLVSHEIFCAKVGKGGINLYFIFIPLPEINILIKFNTFCRAIVDTREYFFILPFTLFYLFFHKN